MIARPSATRCCWPPESCEGLRSSSAGEAEQRRRRGRAARAWSAAGSRRTFRPNRMFSATLRCGNRAYDWNTIEMRRSAGRDAGDVAPVDQDAAFARRVEPGDHAQRRRLAAARRAEQHDELARGGGEAGPVDGLGGAPVLADGVEAERAHRPLRAATGRGAWPARVTAWSRRKAAGSDRGRSNAWPRVSRRAGATGRRENPQIGSPGARSSPRPRRPGACAPALHPHIARGVIRASYHRRASGRHWAGSQENRLRSLAIAIALVFATTATLPLVAEARRIGGGGAIGMQRSLPPRAAPPGRAGAPGCARRAACRRADAAAGAAPPRPSARGWARSPASPPVSASPR